MEAVTIEGVPASHIRRLKSALRKSTTATVSVTFSAEGPLTTFEGVNQAAKKVIAGTIEGADASLTLTKRPPKPRAKAAGDEPAEPAAE